MRRREFITLLGGAAAAWPIRGARAAAGQCPLHRLSSTLASARGSTREGYRSLSAAGCSELGYVEGANIAIDYPLCRR